MVVPFSLVLIGIGVSVWAYHVAPRPVLGVFAAFLLGPTWATCVYSLLFVFDGADSAAHLVVFSLLFGGALFGVPLGCLLAAAQAASLWLNRRRES